MSEIKTVGIKELKNNLSAYLREVRRGIRVLVSDRNRVVAELHEPNAGYLAEDPFDPQLAAWIEGGVVSSPTMQKTKLPTSPVQLDDGAAERLLDDDRRERGR